MSKITETNARIAENEKKDFPVKNQTAKISNKLREGSIMNKNDQQFLAQKIRTQYIDKQFTELDALRALDKKVKRPAGVFAYIFGSLSAIVMGAGMSLIMTNIGETLGLSGNLMIPGIIIGVVGMTMTLVNYPIYKNILNKRKNKYAPQILKLSDRIMNNK